MPLKNDPMCVCAAETTYVSYSPHHWWLWVQEPPGSPDLKRVFPPFPFHGPLLGIETEHGSKQHIH